MDERRLLVLLVEDDFTSRNAIATMLYRKGFNVVRAENGEDAQKVLRTCSPDCIILDLLMPKMHGQAFLTWLRKTDKHLPVIIMSAVQSQPALVTAVEKLGIHGWLHKPIRGKQLIELIAGAVKPQPKDGEPEAEDGEPEAEDGQSETKDGEPQNSSLEK